MFLSVLPVELTLAYWDRVKKSDRLWFDQEFRRLLTEFEASAEKLNGLKKAMKFLKNIIDYKEFKEEYRQILQPCHHNLRLVVDKIDHAKKIDDNDKSGAELFVIFRNSAREYFCELSGIKTNWEAFIKVNDACLENTREICECAIVFCENLLKCLEELAKKKDSESFKKVVIHAGKYIENMRIVLGSEFPIFLGDIRGLFLGTRIGPFSELKDKDDVWAEKKFEEIQKGLSFAEGGDVDVNAEISAYFSKFTNARYTVSKFQGSLQKLADRTKIAR